MFLKTAFPKGISFNNVFPIRGASKRDQPIRRARDNIPRVIFLHLKVHSPRVTLTDCLFFVLLLMTRGVVLVHKLNVFS